MRFFTEQDWYGLAGAESEESGLKRNPSINEKENPLNAVIAVDRNGIQILGYIDGDDCKDYCYIFECTYDLGLVIATYLEVNIAETIEELDQQMTALGFTKIL